MSTFAHMHAEFARALRDPDQPPPRGLQGYSGHSPARRFGVYRNNVTVGLVEALRTRFPATERIVGQDFFVFLSRGFIDRHPPDSPVMMFFGDRLPAFIETFEPAAELSYLPDVARIECARTHAYHAPDAEGADIATLLHLPMEALADARLALHPSLRLVRSRFPAVSIWEMNTRRHDDSSAAIDLDRGEDAIIIRPICDVLVETATAGGAVFIEALQTLPLAEAADQAIRCDEAFNLTQTLAQLIKVGAIVDCRPGKSKDQSSGE